MGVTRDGSDAAASENHPAGTRTAPEHSCLGVQDQVEGEATSDGNDAAVSTARPADTRTAPERSCLGTQDHVDVVADTVTEHARAGAGMITDPVHPLSGDRELHLDHEIASRGEARIEASPPRSVTSNYTRGYHPESSVKCNETSGTPPRDRQRRTRNGNDRRRRRRQRDRRNAASKPCKDVPAGPEVLAVPSAGVGSKMG